MDREELETERVHPGTTALDAVSVAEAFELFQAEDESVAAAVGRAKEAIVRAVELVAASLGAGGRLLYVGAGTSGRLGVLDAAECPPTFQSAPEQVQGVIAGGADALVRSVEGAEDDALAGAREMDARVVGARDVVFGITAGGTTPYVHGALARARERGARTVFFACVPREQVQDEADVSIRVVTGPEVLAGSTRLKAGTATKLVLNRVTTLAMVRLGKTWENLMVDLNARANRKLTARAASILSRIRGVGREEALALLERAEGSVKVAAVMHAHGLDARAARARLAEHEGRLRAALGGDQPARP
jgi:N-acetylmuramic acid 6-phosphate etherase